MYLRRMNNWLVKGVKLGKTLEEKPVSKKRKRERISPSRKGFMQKPVQGKHEHLCVWFKRLMITCSFYLCVEDSPVNNVRISWYKK